MEFGVGCRFRPLGKRRQRAETVAVAWRGTSRCNQFDIDPGNGKKGAWCGVPEEGEGVVRAHTELHNGVHNTLPAKHAKQVRMRVCACKG